MRVERLRHYIDGGRPPGARRVYPGCRDRTPPARSAAVVVPGRVYFATESPVWTSGRGFYDPAAGGVAWCVAHLVTARQFSDIAAQEMYRTPGAGAGAGLAGALATGRARLGPGRYETLLCLGTLAGVPVLTFTAPWRMGDVELRRPAAPYVAHLAAGLAATGAWGRAEVAAYLAGCPGARGHWTPEDVGALMAAG
ncbi:histone deacetylase [Streptomyces sp. NPDC049879]|uniref:histone deacetylase n=1 Tax=Streptomyces sp. NPDC049879 TaxID=3365598 RepID=UPI0037A52698